MPNRFTGLTDPYHGQLPCARFYARGMTFRWVRGDTLVAVQRGTCVDGRRAYIFKDTLQDHPIVLDGEQPVVDVCPTLGEQWGDPPSLRRIAKRWFEQQ